MSSPDFVRRYQPSPDSLAPEHWHDVREFAQQAVLDAVDIEYYSDDQTRAFLGYIARLASFTLHIYGAPLTYESVFTEERIHSFFLTSVDAGSHAKGSRRSMMEAVGRVLNPAGFRLGDKLSYGYTPAQAPYSDGEVRALEDWSRSQGSAERNADARMILALGLGAGLRASEIANSTGTDVVEDGDAVLVLPHGYRGAGRRRSVVTHSFEDDVRNRVAQVGREGFLFKPDSRNRATSIISTFIKRSLANGRLRPDTRRLRSTWIVDHLYGGVPQSVICDMAGLADLQHYSHWVQQAGTLHAPEYVEQARRVGRRHGLSLTGEVVSLEDYRRARP